MTAAVPAGDGRQGLWDWLVEWSGHHSWAYWLVLMFNDYVYRFLGSVAGYVVSGTALAVVLIGFGHDRKSLCQRCMRNAPLDPQREIQRYDRLLRLHHGITPKRMLIGGAIWLALALGASYILASLGSPWWGLLPVSVVLWFPPLIMSISGEWHQWLRPWCPYCRRWDDGGTPEIVPDPVPSAEKETT